MSSNPVEVPKLFFFFGFSNLQLLKLQLLLGLSHLHLSLYFRSSHHLYSMFHSFDG